MKPSYETGDNYDTMIALIEQGYMSGEDVLNYLTDWHGLQLLDYDFTENLLVELGELDEDEEEEE